MFSIDGCFGFRSKKKESYGEDDGIIAAYFVEESDLKKYREKVPQVQDVRIYITVVRVSIYSFIQRSGCSNISAVNAQNKSKFQWAVKTGILSVTCMRHGVFQIRATLNLIKGERCVITFF